MSASKPIVAETSPFYTRAHIARLVSCSSTLLGGKGGKGRPHRVSASSIALFAPFLLSMTSRQSATARRISTDPALARTHAWLGCRCGNNFGRAVQMRLLAMAMGRSMRGRQGQRTVEAPGSPPSRHKAHLGLAVHTAEMAKMAVHTAEMA